MIIGEQPVIHRKLNKRGKPVGKLVLTGFTLDLNAPLTVSSASNPANYEIDTLTIKKSKKTVKHILHPIQNFTVSYVADSDAVQLTLGSRQTFPKGGQITVLAGLSNSSGGALFGPVVFTIAKGGKSIVPS